MTRISDLGLQQLLLAGFQRAQASAEERQIQLSSGKVSQDYSGIGTDTPALLSSEAVMSRVDAFSNAADVALSRLQTREASLTSMADALALVRDRAVSTLATGAAELFIPEVENAAIRFAGALNAQSGGVYVFGGVNGDAPPLDAQTLDDFGAAASIASLFNTGARNTLPVDAGLAVDGGATALEIGADGAAILQSIANAEATLGVFSGQINDAQRAFLIDLVASLDDASAAINVELGLNGVAQSQAEDAKTRLGLQRDQAELAVSRIEDADLASVIARLNQDRLAIEASARALAQASELSLLNFI